MKHLAVSLFILGTLFLTSSCSFSKHKIRYEVNCTKCIVSYIKEKDENVLRKPISGIWSYEFLAYEGQRLSLAAANTDTLSDKISVFIFHNETLVDSLSKGGKKWSAASVAYLVE